MADDFPGRGEPRGNGFGSVVAFALPLAHRPDFQLGAATVRPSLRTVEGPGGSVETEPRVMQVLLAFADADGAVLTRENLLNTCWNGQIVGDDAINRAIFELRRIARTAQAGFGVETIPRIGYRLTVSVGELGSGSSTAYSRVIDPAPEPPSSATRRWLMAGGLAAATVGGLGIWSLLPKPANPRVAGLIDQGTAALRYGLPDSKAQGVAAFRQAVAIDPDNAAAWGLFALALHYEAELDSPRETAADVPASEQAARRALAIDSKEPNALLALAMLRFALDDLVTTENKLREILTIAPENIATIEELVYLLQGVGRSHDSWAMNQRAAALEPLSPSPQYRRALKLWIFGRQDEADQVIDRAMQLWPQHPFVWNARLLIFAFTGRPRAGLSMIADKGNTPAMLPPAAVAVWRASLVALDTGSAGDIAAARDANLAAAPHGPGLAAYAIMILSALKELDAAYGVADGFLLRRGPLVGTWATGVSGLASSPGWKNTQWLFTPATAPLRADPRFGALAEATGLAEYWRRRRVRPDYTNWRL